MERKRRQQLTFRFYGSRDSLASGGCYPPPLVPRTIGKLDKAWDDARAKGWTVVSMKNDWRKVFAFQ